jgi:hypothetical protein
MLRTRDLRPVLGLALGLMAGIAACSGGAAPSPFTLEGSGGEAGSDSPASGGTSTGGRAAGSDDPTIGGPCVDAAQCDDGADCTDDSCNSALGRCRFVPNADRCADGVYCNGIEVCEPKVGCHAGEPVSCSDGSSCTIDRCLEESRSCEHAARDADGDGDPTWNCGGGDCADDDATVSSTRPEICGNGRDDDCDDVVDETDCVRPEHDGCADALVVDGAQSFDLSLTAASEDVATSCAMEDSTRRDVVVAIQVPEGPALDVLVTAQSRDKGLALAAFDACSKGATELACFSGVGLPSGADGNVARLWLRALEPGAYPLYVSGVQDDDVSLDVEYRDASEPPSNETCGTAFELVPENKVVAALFGAKQDVKSACLSSGGDLVYRFQLSEPQDVTLRAVSLDGAGVPTLSLRSKACTAAKDELDCRVGAPARLFERALPAGTYFVALSASGPSEIELGLTLEPPTEAAPGEGCDAPAALEPNRTLGIDLIDNTNAVAATCLAGAVDATHSFHVDERSDVLLVERLSEGDRGAISFFPAGCAPESALTCVSSTNSPVRARAFGVRPADYAVVAESALGTPVEVSVFSRPAAPTTLVVAADGCTDAVTIPEAGGRFSGNTRDVSADFDAGCDYGGVQSGGAPEQMLRLHLDEAKRVIFDMSGSDYNTLLDVRSAVGGACPGQEITYGCAPGRSQAGDRSFLDLTLAAGDYFIQVDGFAGASGQWSLDVYVANP